MLNRPVVIKRVLEPDFFYDVNKTIHHHMRWAVNNYSEGPGDSANDPVSWGVVHKNCEPIIYKAATIIKLKILRHIRQKIQICKIHYNAQTSGQASKFHKDFSQDLCWTFVLFTEKHWNTQWGGEFVCEHPLSGEYFHTPYIPNSGVLIPSNWQHYGQSPSAITDKVRTTLAICYMEAETLEDEIQYYKSEGEIDTLHEFV